MAGGYHSLAIDEFSNIWSWGYNNYGQLGDGSTTKHLSPIKIETEVKFKEISAGNSHSLARDENDNIWSWGRNVSGELGDGSTTNHSTPIKIETEAKFKEISAGFGHSLAIDEFGNIWSWGRNNYGQLGDGTKSNSNMPIKIDMGETKFKEIVAGDYYSLALDENGNIWSWGRNDEGQLGDGTKNNSNMPIKIDMGETKFKEIMAGSYHSLAIDEFGNIWSWGRNDVGQLGNGSMNEQLTLIKIDMGETKFREIMAGGYHSLAIDEFGNIWSWGENYHGSLGNGTTENSLIPMMILF